MPIFASRLRPIPSRMRRSTLSRRRATPSCAFPCRTSTTSARNFSAGSSPQPWPVRSCGINPFNQPDVEASKIETRKLTEEYEKKGVASARISADRRRRHQAFHRREKCRRPQAIGERWHASWLFARPSCAHQGWRLFRRARLHPDERAPRIRAAINPSRRARHQARGHLPRLRSRGSCIPPAKLTRAAPIPAYFCKSLAMTRMICPCPARNTPSAL